MKYKDLKPNTKLTTGYSDLIFIREVKSNDVVELEYNGEIIMQKFSVFKRDFEAKRFKIVE